MRTNHLPQRFEERLQRLTQQPGRRTLRLTFTHGAAADAPAMSGALRACFDQLTRDYLLPQAWISTGGGNYCLTPAGDGLRSARPSNGAARGAAGSDVLDLLIGGQIHLAAQLTETGYQPQLVVTVSAPTAQIIDQVVPVLERWLSEAGCEATAL